MKKFGLGFLIIFTAIFSSCEKDLYEDAIQNNTNPKQTFNVEYLSEKDAEKIKEVTDLEIKTYRSKAQNRGSDTLNYGTIKYDQVMKVVDNLGNKTYMLRVDHPDQTYEKFYNMILQEKIDGSKYVKLFEYNMTGEFADKYYSGLKQLKDFEGSYNYRMLSINVIDINGTHGDGGGGGGSSGGGGTNDGNTGNPTGGSPYDQMGGNTSSGVGSIGQGDPCTEGGGGIGGQSGEGASDGGSGGGAGDDGSSSCFILVAETNKIYSTSNSSCWYEITYLYVDCTGNRSSVVNEGSIRNRGVNDANPCTSSNNGVTILSPTFVSPTPCDQLKKLGEPTKNNIKPNVDLLKQKVNSANNKNEIGFESKKNTNPDGSISFTNTDVTSANQFNVSLITGGPNIGGGHSHPDNSYPMFSFGDVKFLQEAYNNASSTRQEEVFYIVVCKNSNTGIVNTYCIRVDDISILDNSITAVWDDPIYSNFSPNGVNGLNSPRIDEIHRDQAFTYSKCGGDYEKSFLQQFNAFGISLYEATDNTMTKWSKIELDANPINPLIKTPCN